jgi:hypothetical protein
VARLLGDHREDDKAQLTIVEEPPAMPPAEVSAVMMMSMAPPFRVLGMGEPTV